MTNLAGAMVCGPERQLESGAERVARCEDVLAVEQRATRASADAVCLHSCRPFEAIVVTTRGSVYELIVVQGEVGDVLVRGGAKFPEFQRALFVGSTTGGSVLKAKSIGVGLRMEFHLGHRIVVTSAVRAVSRGSAPTPGA